MLVIANKVVGKILQIMFSGEYSEINVPSAASVINRLSDRYGAPTTTTRAFEESDDHLFSEFPHPLLPTVGIEIELPHRELDPNLSFVMPRGTDYDQLDDSKREQADQIFDGIDNTWKPRMTDLAEAGLIIGDDSFSELIFPPYYSSNELNQLVSYLYEAGLVPNGRELPLHITLGGIDASSEPLHLQRLARMVELLDGTTDRRLHEPLMGSMSHWVQKDKRGYLERRPSELAGDEHSGVELRALSARSSEQLTKVTWRAQWMGACLKAWLEASNPERANSVNTVPFDGYERGAMIDTWISLTQFFDNIYKINDAPLDEAWGAPMDRTEFWLKHHVMCSTNLINMPQKKQLCEVVDGVLRDIRGVTLRHYGSRLAMRGELTD